MMVFQPSASRSPRLSALSVAAGKLFTFAGLLKVALMLALMTFAALIGISTVFLPWYLYVGAAMALVYPVLVFKAPWIAFTLYVAGTFVAPGFKTADALTLVALALFALRWLQSERPSLLPAPLAKPFLAFVVTLLVALAVGLFKGHPFSMIYGDGRGFLYWFWLPILYSLVKAAPEGLRKCAQVFLFAAAFIAIVALAQYFTGVQVVAAGRVAGLDAANAGQTRVQMHGFLFIAVAAVFALVALAHSPRRILLLLPFLLLMLAALYANFGRALWFWTAVAVALSVFLSGQRRGLILALMLAVGGVFAGGGLLLFKPKVVDNIVERAMSVRDEGGARTSYGWRKLENQDAMPHILQNPLTGLGLGAEYRRWMHEVAAFDQHTRYVHNSYVFVALKAGLPCLAAMLLLLLTAWWRGWRGTRRTDTPQWAMRVAALASLFPLLGVSITQPELVTPMSALLLVLLAVLLSSGEEPLEVPAGLNAAPKPIT